MRILLYSEPELKKIAEESLPSARVIASTWVKSSKLFIDGDINEYVFRFPSQEAFKFSMVNLLNTDHKVMRDFFKQEFNRYYTMLYRRNLFSIRNPYSVRSMFSYHFGLAIGIIRSSNFDLVLGALPSTGYDYILFKLAESHGCKVLYLNQYFYNRFFWTTKLDDFLFFRNKASIFPKSTVKVKQGENEKFYLSRSFKPESASQSEKPFLISESLSVFCSSALHSARKLTERLHHSIEIRLSRWTLYFEEAAARESFRDSLKSTAKCTCLYALHYVPEAGTLGVSDPFYEGDLGSIFKLLSLMPQDSLIYVKEHPNQHLQAWFRPKNFWELLLSDSRVIRVPARVDPAQLLSHVNFVATVNGTIGWEALKHGRPVLVFGSAWYSGAPGTLNGCSITSLTELDSLPQWSLSDLAQFLSNLSSTMGVGFVNHRDYVKAKDEFSEIYADIQGFELESNNVIVWKSISKIIERICPDR